MGKNQHVVPHNGAWAVRGEHNGRVTSQHSTQSAAIGAVLLNMAVFGAVLAYILQMASFILLRVRFANIARPYRSPVGIPGALVAALIASGTLVMLFRNPDYNKGVIGAAVWFVLGIAYYATYARRRLVLAPEEEAAFAHRRTRVP